MSEEEKKNNIKEYQKQYQNSYQKANTKKSWADSEQKNRCGTDSLLRNKKQ